MESLQTIDNFYYTIDDEGFLKGTIRVDAVNDFNKNSVVEAVLPSDSLSHLERWRWVDSAWIKAVDFRGHSWYDPMDTNKVHNPKTFYDAPPEGWLYWPAGENPIKSQSELLRKEWNEIRRRRNSLLVASDWTQLPDVPLATKEAWAVYRQQLRDITDQPDPFNVVWPIPPG